MALHLPRPGSSSRRVRLRPPRPPRGSPVSFVSPPVAVRDIVSTLPSSFPSTSLPSRWAPRSVPLLPHLNRVLLPIFFFVRLYVRHGCVQARTRAPLALATVACRSHTHTKLHLCTTRTAQGVGFPGRPRRFHPPHRATVSLLDFSQFRQFHLSRVPCSCTSDPIKKNSYVPSFHSWTL
jgi:hypothetical protein